MSEAAEMQNLDAAGQDSADSALWAEVVAGFGKSDPAPKEEPPATPPDDQSTGDGAAGGKAKQGDGETAQGAGETAQPAGEPEDLWASATEAQRKAFQDLEHGRRSDQGRVSALQRQINDLQRQLEAANKPPPAAAPPLGQIDWAAFERDYPDEAKALKTLQAESEAKISALQQRLESNTRAAGDQFYDLLDGIRPGWRDTVNSPAFEQWLSAQSEPTREQFHSSKIGDALGLLRSFDEHQTAQAAKAAQLKKDREDRAKKSESVPGRATTPSMDEGVENPDAAWDAAVAKVRKMRGR